jgi:hypothetical protein
VKAKGSILAKHLYFDQEITRDYDLRTEAGRRGFLRERCYIVFELTKSRAEAQFQERLRESCGSFRYIKTVHKRTLEADEMICECGCGESAVSGSFKPGHDQKLRTALEQRVGGLLALRSLVEAAENYAGGLSPIETLAQSVGVIFKTSRT